MSAKVQIVVDYDTDFFEWSQGQAQLLKSLRLAYPNLPADLDIDNIAEEIEALGRADLHAVESQLQNILVPLLKAVSTSNAQAGRHWRAEGTAFHADLVRKYSRSMRQRVDMERTWRLAQRVSRDQLIEHGDELVLGLPKQCPFTIDALVSDDFDFDAAQGHLTRSIGISPSA